MTTLEERLQALENIEFIKERFRNGDSQDKELRADLRYENGCGFYNHIRGNLLNGLYGLIFIARDSKSESEKEQKINRAEETLRVYVLYGQLLRQHPNFAKQEFTTPDGAFPDINKMPLKDYVLECEKRLKKIF